MEGVTTGVWVWDWAAGQRQGVGYAFGASARLHSSRRGRQAKVAKCRGCFQATPADTDALHLLHHKGSGQWFGKHVLFVHGMGGALACQVGVDIRFAAGDGAACESCTT